MSKKIHLDIGGMTCINCQNKIQNGLNGADGIIEAKVSYSKGCADIEYDENKISKKDILKIIEDLDYTPLSPDKGGSFDITGSISILLLIIVLYYLLQSSGILNKLVPQQLADSGMGYGMLFVIGLITSVHCIAMCGGIGLSQSISGKNSKGKSQTFTSSLVYNLGRVCSYTLIGFVLGFIGMIIGGGSDIGISSMVQGILKIVAGLFMVIMGINLIGIFPWLGRLSIHTPVAIAKIIGKKRRTATAPFIIGMLNGLMPCGPLQSMWIVALATANPFAGALSMFMFSLGTVPLMLGLGSTVALLGKKFKTQVAAVGGILVVVLGLAMISQGGSLSGFTPSTLFAAGREEAAEGKIEEAEEELQLVDGAQIVTSTLSPGVYPDITVKKGIPVRWIINAPEGSLNGCNYVMLIQDYGIEHAFDFGENIIEFTPDKAGVVRYSCWMGMINANIYVEE